MTVRFVLSVHDFPFPAIGVGRRRDCQWSHPETETQYSHYPLTRADRPAPSSPKHTWNILRWA